MKSDKTILLAFIAAVACLALAKPQKGINAAYGTEYAEDAPVPTAADYIQGGLCILWDGIENIDWGVHSDAITTWIDLMSGLTIPNVKVVDGIAIDFTKDGTSKSFTLVRNIVSSAYMTFEVVTQEQDVYAYSWFQRSRNGGSAWTTSLSCNWSYGQYFGNFFYFPDSTRSPNTRTLSIDGELVRVYCGGSLCGEIPVPEPHIDEGRCIFNSGVKICCVRLYDRPLTPDEMSHNNLIDKARFGL